MNLDFTGFEIVFQSTLPLRGATAIGKLRNSDKEFQSTLPLRGATFVLVFFIVPPP